MALNLAQAIHQRWAADQGLGALLPESQVYTGMSPDPTLPFAVISRLDSRPKARPNDGSATDAIAVRIELFHGNYDAAAALLEQVKATFERADFAVDESTRVVNMRRASDQEEQRDDGVWHVVIDFDCTVYHNTSDQ
jgi:hypothetical protein